MTNVVPKLLRSVVALLAINTLVACAPTPSPAPALSATPSLIGSQDDHAAKVDRAEAQAEASCPGQTSRRAETNGELVSDYLCFRPILHNCHVAGADARVIPFAMLQNGGGVLDTRDPEDIIPLDDGSMAFAITTTRDTTTIEVPLYLAQGPHQEYYEHPGDAGGKIEIAYLNAAKSRAAITITHFRKPPAGPTTIFKGRCSVKRGKAAIRAFDKLGE